MTRRLILTTVLLAAATTPLFAGELIALSAGCHWRKHYTFFPPRLTVAAAKEKGIPTDPASRAKALAGQVRSGLHTPPPPDGWTRPEFDDAHWFGGSGVGFTTGDGRAPAGWPLFQVRGCHAGTVEVGLIVMRGRFRVEDPAKVKRLRLSVTYRGGFVAYLNGREIARPSMPKGKVHPDTPAGPYPLDAFLAPGEKGKRHPLHWWNHQKKEFHPHWKARERSAGPIAIKPGLLRKGVNVLALEFHRTDYPIECTRKKVGLCFATLGLVELLLKADTPADNIVASDRRPPGLQLWNADPWASVSDTGYGNPLEPLRPVRIAAARNGSFSGKVVVGSTQPIEELKTTMVPLKSKAGAIQTEHIRVRFAALNPLHRGGRFSRVNGIGGTRFDRLLDAPPAKVEPTTIAKATGAQATIRNAYGLPLEVRNGAVIPVWITVRVPKDAPAGDYTGTLTIAAKGVRPVLVPVHLSVADWTLPDLKDYVTLIFIYQSPETLARYYKVAMWSEAHWKLIEKSLALMGGIGNIGLIFPFTAESCHGNPETMVHWIPKGGPSASSGQAAYDCDWTNFDRYLKIAMKYHHASRLKVVAINVWGNEVRPSRHTGKMHGALVTAKDPKTGKRTNIKVPAYGTAACEAFWRPVLLAIKERLKAYGLDGKLMLGVGNDSSPSWDQVAMFRRILPGAPWFRESHYNAWGFRYDAKDRRKTVPVGCNSIVWGGAVNDPKRRRLYGWRYDRRHLVLNFNRPGASSLILTGFPPPWSYRMWMESTIACGRNGNGRVGGDYWNLGVSLHKLWKGRVSSEAGGGSRGTLFGSYPQSSVGQTGLGNNTTDLFAPGPDGPVTTVRFENAREGNQEAEARAFVEKALLAKTLPAELATRCQALLDERTNVLRLKGYAATWRRSNRRLFALAGEVAKAPRIEPPKDKPGPRK